MDIANPRCWCVSPDNLRFLFEMNLCVEPQAGWMCELPLSCFPNASWLLLVKLNGDTDMET